MYNFIFSSLLFATSVFGLHLSGPRLSSPLNAIDSVHVPKGLCDTVDSISGFFPADDQGKKQYFY